MGIEEEKDPTAKFIKCRNCNKKFTQTIHKGKKSSLVCPHCGTHNTEKKETNEGFIRSDLPADERYKIVADKVIEFMDNQKTQSIPDYSTLANWNPEPETTFKTNMKTLLQRYVRQGEYFEKIVPLIKSLRPDFTSSYKSGRHRVDEYVVVYSNGEKILFNTFKMNGVTLVPHPKEYEFEYNFEDKVLIKKPDFYWPQKNELIEVAGLEDASFKKDYMKKLLAAKEQSPIPMIIVDYFQYRKNLQGFYKFVCQKFGFPYDPLDFWTANIVRDLPVEDLKREAKDLAKKGVSKKFGERLKQSKILQLLGYKSAWDFRQEEGIGMRWADPKLREQVKKAWCESSGSHMATYNKFKELFQGIPFSKTMVETMKKKFPSEFDDSKRTELCGENLVEGLLSTLKDKLIPKPFGKYQKIVDSYLDSQDFRVIKYDDGNGKHITVIYSDSVSKPEFEISMGWDNKTHERQKKLYIQTRVIRNLENYIPQKGLIVCIVDWVKRKTGDNSIEGYELS